jgi:hypothetical protein
MLSAVCFRVVRNSARMLPALSLVAFCAINLYCVAEAAVAEAAERTAMAAAAAAAVARAQAAVAEVALAGAPV